LSLGEQNSSPKFCLRKSLPIMWMNILHNILFNTYQSSGFFLPKTFVYFLVKYFILKFENLKKKKPPIYQGWVSI
jgi:hypothetical protein